MADSIGAASDSDLLVIANQAIAAAVFRPSASTWYMNRSTTGVQIVSFGLPTDQPVPNAYVR